MSRNNLRVLGGAAACGLVFVAALAAGGRADVGAQAPTSVGLDPTLMATYQWRSIGPDRGGRSIAAAGVKGQPNIAYFGATGGGLWKTTDRGETWTPVTDKQITSASVGAVAVAESNPDIVYIGTGESCIRGNIMPGDGMYKSTDAGKSWKHIGFRDAQNISKIRVHPTNADIVFVAAFGQHGVPNDERGIFKSTDGGATWRKVLFRNAQTGGVDLSLDRNNPNVIYAALWEAFRKEYTMSSGGPGSGLFKSTDGGENWTELTKAPGMPTGVVGRIGVSVSGADSTRVYALVENENGGLLRSDNGGHELDDGQPGPQHQAARLLLHACHCRSQEQGHGVSAERRAVQVHGRWQVDSWLGRRVAQRQPRPLDRPGRPAAHGARQ